MEYKAALSGTTPFDLFIVFFLLLLSVGIVTRTAFSNTGWNTSENTAVIYSDGKELRRIHLGENSEYGLLEGRMAAVVKDGKIRIEKSDCPGNVCVHAGWIHSPGETLMCVPNRIVVEIIADTGPEVDAVVF